jgi:hypothetical protein
LIQRRRWVAESLKNGALFDEGGWYPDGQLSGSAIFNRAGGTEALTSEAEPEASGEA